MIFGLSDLKIGYGVTRLRDSFLGPDFVSSANDTMGYYVILAESQLIGGHTEYYVLCGLGVPSLVAMGCRTEPAIVHSAHVLQKLHFFQFFNLLYKLHDLPQKKITRIYLKKRFNFCYNSHNLPQNKITRIYRQKKLHDLTVFLYTSYIFHILLECASFVSQTQKGCAEGVSRCAVLILTKMLLLKAHCAFFDSCVLPMCKQVCIPTSKVWQTKQRVSVVNSDSLVTWSTQTH